MVRRLLLGSILAAVVALAMAASAGAADSIYWGFYEGSDLSYASLAGGSGAVITPTPNPPTSSYGVGVDAATGKLYWADLKRNRISSSNLDGSASGDLSTGAASLIEPNGVAVDVANGRIYWANASANKISWANLDGTGGGDLDTSGAPVDDPFGVVVSPANGRIYWANYSGNSIGYASLDGSGGGGELPIPTADLEGPDSVAIDALNDRLYWTNWNAGTIGYSDLNGLGAGLLDLSGQELEAPTGLAIDPAAGRIYWADEGSAGSAGMIASVAVGGGSPQTLDTGGADASSPSFPFLFERPLATAAPTLSGATTVGSTLTCTPATWAGDLVESFLYRVPQSTATSWTLNGTTIAGATGATLATTQPGQYGCRSTATNGAGSTTVASTAEANVVAQPRLALPSVGIEKIKFDRRHGTATLLVQVSGPGTVTLSGKRIVRRTATASGVGIVKLKVAARGKARRALVRTGKAKVHFRLALRTTENGTASRSRSITLHRRLGH